MPLCDTLLRLAEDPSFYRPLWSEQILQEVGDTLLKHGYSESQRDRRLNFMRQFFPEAMVEVPDELVKAIALAPDADDSHILAAAIIGKANAIIHKTRNTSLRNASKGMEFCAIIPTTSWCTSITYHPSKSWKSLTNKPLTQSKAGMNS